MTKPAQEGGGRPNLDTQRLERRIRKVASVISDDHLGLGADWRGQDVTIAGIVRHRADVWLVAANSRLREVAAQFRLASPRLCGRQFPFPDKVPRHLLHNRPRPPRQIKARRLGHAKKRVRQRHRDEDTRVQHDARVSRYLSSPPSGMAVRSYRPDSKASLAMRPRAALRSKSRRLR